MSEEKIVTILLFGPSMKLGVPVVGEAWTTNRAYDILMPEEVDRCTRLFDMHLIDELRQTRAADGLPHLHHLNTLGRKGVRIVMQDATSEVANSESFPLTAVQARWPMGMFSGGEQYLISLALFEGYTHIRLAGADFSDYTHQCHREGIMWWMGVAQGMGVSVDGPLRLLSRYTKRYGYDYGGYGTNGLCEYQTDLTYEAFPFVVDMKMDWFPASCKK